jgi:FtsP/CotA-like multicopper oxidase with cupredoxin domain
MREACGAKKNGGAGCSDVKRVRWSSSEMSRNFTRRSLAFVLGSIIFALLMLFPLLGMQSTSAQSNSPAFRNPPEVCRRPKEKRLRAIMKMVNKEFSVPNVELAQYRQFRGWDADEEEADAGSEVGPGPTLRARVGDQVQIAFLNKVNKNRFSYSEVTGRDEPPFSDAGCDHVGKPDAKGRYHYPASDKYPNCFHGSNTANIHFHGTHTSPDGLGDNVLVQVLPQMIQPNWTPSFNELFNSRFIPQTWSELPIAFRREQLALVNQHDIDAATAARKNGLDPPEPLLKTNLAAIAAGQWPQYFVGAFPNFFQIPDYDKDGAPFNSGGNGFKAGQSPGTHWYHAHKHGSTSLNIRNGLAGVFIIESSREGGYDHFIRKSFGWGDEYGDHEKIFIFQQYDPTQNLERKKAREGDDPAQTQIFVNGQLRPIIIMSPGEIQLWRFINATEGNANGVIDGMTLKEGLFGVKPSSGFDFKQTAQDGVQFSPDNYGGQPFLSGKVPGGFKLAAANRADLLVKAPTTLGRTEFKSGDTILFVVEVAGKAVTTANSFPSDWAAMPRFLLDLPKPGLGDEPNPNSPVKFQWEKGRSTIGRDKKTGDPPHFMINDKQFGQDGPKVDQCMPKDGLQDWVLENHTTVIAHPFHIHINPFQVIRIEAPTDKTNPLYVPDHPVWQDVIAIPPAEIKPDGSVVPGRVIIRQAYPDFTGTFVLHCHILAHEDRGMMQLVRIVPSSQYGKGKGKGCQGLIPEHH